MFIHSRLTRHVSGIIMPIVRRTDCIKPRLVLAWMCWLRLCGVRTRAEMSAQDRFLSPVSNFTKILKPHYMRTDGRTDGRRMAGRTVGHDEWRILIRRSGLAGGYKRLPVILPLDLIYLYSPLMKVDLERLTVTRRPTGGQHCRRSCRPSTALR